MSEWIECNLPWNHYGTLAQAPKYPNLNKKIKKLFGKTVPQAYKEISSQYKYGDGKKAYKSAVNKYKNFRKKVEAWVKEQPEHKTYVEDLKKHNEMDKLKSFCGRGLNKVGTMIEIVDNGMDKKLLIGDVNALGGVCDDCMGFDREVIVLRYKVAK